MNLKKKNTAKNVVIWVLAAAAIAGGATAAYYGISQVRNTVDNAVGGTVNVTNVWSVKAADIIDSDAAKIKVDDKAGSYTNLTTASFDLYNHLSNDNIDYQPIYVRFALDKATAGNIAKPVSASPATTYFFYFGNSGLKTQIIKATNMTGLGGMDLTSYVQQDGTMLYSNVVSKAANADGVAGSGKWYFSLPAGAVLSDVKIFNLNQFGYSSESKCLYIFDKLTAGEDKLADKLTFGKKDILKYAEQWDDAHPAATASSAVSSAAATSAAA